MKFKKYFCLLLALLLIMVVSLSTVCAASKTITFWHYWTDEEGKSLDKILDQFNKANKSFQVKYLSNLDYDQHHTKLLTAISGGNPPDVSVCSSDFLPQWVANGAVLSLDGYIKASKFSLKDYYDSSLKLGKINGKQYSLPLCQDSYAILINKTLLKKAGIDPDKAPRTIAEFDKMIEKLTIKDAKGNITQAGFIPNFPWGHTWQVAFAFGGKFYDEKKKKITANDPNIVKALEWELNIYKKYGAKAINAFMTGHGEYGTAGYPFYTGKLAMVIDGEWQTNFISLYAPKDFEWGVWPFPGVKDTPQLYGQTQTTSTGFVIPKGAKNQKEAWEFIKWMESKEGSGAFCKAICNVPPFKSLGEDPSFTSDPRFKVFMDQLKNPYVQIWPQMPVAYTYSSELGSAEEAILVAGNKTPKKAMDDLTKQIQAELDKALKKK